MYGDVKVCLYSFLYLEQNKLYLGNTRQFKGKIQTREIRFLVQLRQCFYYLNTLCFLCYVFLATRCFQYAGCYT
jgi:hypothetical protein